MSEEIWIEQALKRLNYQSRHELRRSMADKITEDFTQQPSEQKYKESANHIDMGNGNFVAKNRIGDNNYD